MIKDIAVIGAGISGLSVARMLQEKFSVTVFEQADRPGGLITCQRVTGNLFHKVGGHVFNSHNKEVRDWFWSYFDRDNEFLKATRNAKILLNNTFIGYPLENHLYQLPAPLLSDVLDDLLRLHTRSRQQPCSNFEEFLKSNFGPTLYELYFKPYNEKIWGANLSEVPLGWLADKLPMPDLKQILRSNIGRERETNMVHSSFYYPRHDGSQFIVNRLAEGLDLKLNTRAETIVRKGERLMVNATGPFDAVIYCGDIRRLEAMYQGAGDALAAAFRSATALKSTGTSTLFCECDPTDLSWLYLPEPGVQAHRIIYTGNFSSSNNRGSDRITCVVEFAGACGYDQMCKSAKGLPGDLKPLYHHYEPHTYIIQDKNSRAQVATLKNLAEEAGLYLVGRFAEWEYHNMDKCIEAAMQVNHKLQATNGEQRAGEARLASERQEQVIKEDAIKDK